MIKINPKDLTFDRTEGRFGNEYVEVISCYHNNKKVGYIKYHELENSYEEYWNFISEEEFKKHVGYRNYISLDGIWTDKKYRHLGIGRLMMKVFLGLVEKKYNYIPVILLEIDSFDGTKTNEELRTFYEFFGFETLQYGGFDGFQSVMIKPINGNKLTVETI